MRKQKLIAVSSFLRIWHLGVSLIVLSGYSIAFADEREQLLGIAAKRSPANPYYLEAQLLENLQNGTNNSASAAIALYRRVAWPNGHAGLFRIIRSYSAEPISDLTQLCTEGWAQPVLRDLAESADYLMPQIVQIEECASDGYFVQIAMRWVELARNQMLPTDDIELVLGAAERKLLPLDKRRIRLALLYAEIKSPDCQKVVSVLHRTLPYDVKVTEAYDRCPSDD